MLSVSIPRRPTDSEFFPGHTFLNLLNNLRCNLFRTTFFVAWLLPGYCFTGCSTFFDHLAFELCKAQHDMEYQTTSRGVVDQAHVEDMYRYSTIQQLFHGFKTGCRRSCNELSVIV